VTLSSEEAIARLKAEIIAQDWQLPPRRIQPLEEAVTALRSNYPSRKHMLNLLSMTGSTLNYAKKHEGSVIPECIDFLKEALAHIVRMHEDTDTTAEEEKNVFDRLYLHFMLLKERIKSPTASKQDDEDILASAAASLADAGKIESSESQTSGANRRKNSRIPFEAVADIKLGNITLKGCETRDLSLKGVFVIGVPERKVGESCTLEIHLSGSSTDLTIEVNAEVLRSTPEGVALHFKEIDLESFTHLKNVLYYNLGDPEIIDQEIANQLHSG
jgi:hypothetical protein